MKRFVYYKRFQPIFNQSDEMGGRVMVDGEGRWDREKEGGSRGGGGGGGGHREDPANIHPGRSTAP